VSCWPPINVHADLSIGHLSKWWGWPRLFRLPQPPEINRNKMTTTLTKRGYLLIVQPTTSRLHCQVQKIIELILACKCDDQRGKLSSTPETLFWFFLLLFPFILMAVLLAICTLLVILLVFSHSVLGFKSLFEYRMSKLVAVFLAICSYNFSQPVAVGPVCHRAGHGPTCKSRCLEEYPADT
jgi:hypothetical protein